MSSVFSAKTGLASILKAYSPSERDKAKSAAINKVRFEMPKQKGLLEVISAVRERNNFQPLNEYVNFLREIELSDVEFFRILSDARAVVHELSPIYTNLVEALLALPWTMRTPEALHTYTEFCIDILVAHSKYIIFFIPHLITLWIPADTDASLWNNGIPDDTLRNELQEIHTLLERILTVIPLSFDVILDSIECKFPYYKKAPHVLAGYLHNVLWLIEYKPLFMEFVVQLVLQKLIILDVNAPRSEIEETEDNEEDDEIKDEEMFEMDFLDKAPIDNQSLPMHHPIAQTLDICMEKMCTFFDTKKPNGFNLSEDEKLQQVTETTNLNKILLTAFDNVVLPSHNTHHVQFLMLYYCSFKHSLAESFLNTLWNKIQNPNVPAVIRQSAVNYIASFLARAKYLSIGVLKHFLKHLCDWAHEYIARSDQYRSNGSLKANLVFFSVCQAIFYVIAFRSRALTVDKKSLLFLQSLQLSALVSCNFNPLRVCLPTVATAFAGVTRAYQLAYCHSVLERNARRKLATVYANDTATPEETLDVYFPFDPYLLKMSSARITPLYLQYQASEAEEASLHNTICSEVTKNVSRLQRKRGDSEMIDDHDVDDFLIADKRQCFADLAKSQERDSQFTYGLSPGFHI